MNTHSNTQKIEGQKLDAPLIIQGQSIDEPEHYIAEKPYDLTKYEFSILRRDGWSEFWFNVISGATVGLLISIFGKIIQSLLNKSTPIFESWELWSVAIGFLFSLLFKFAFKSKDEKTKNILENSIDDHFVNHKPRKLHLTKREN